MRCARADSSATECTRRNFSSDSTRSTAGTCMYVGALHGFIYNAALLGVSDMGRDGLAVPKVCVGLYSGMHVR